MRSYRTVGFYRTIESYRTRGLMGQRGLAERGRLTVPQARKCLWGLALYTGQGGLTEQGLGVL